jgi:glutathione peroxidase
MKLRHIALFFSMLLTALVKSHGVALAEGGTPVDWTKLPLPALEGGAIDPATLTGKVVLVVNTASFCGFTPQYEGLEAVWKRYRDQGLVVLGVPANDFGAQEPGTATDIKRFCETEFGIDFPMLAKQTVVGPGAHPLYLWAAKETGPQGVPKWNFHKLLISRDGKLVGWYGSTVKPDGDTLRPAIEGALAQPAS